MRVPNRLALAVLCSAALQGCSEPPLGARGDSEATGPLSLDGRLRFELAARSFTGRIESSLESRLGRAIDSELAELGRLLFFDPILSITEDNSCAGCHGPNVSFNDSKSIAIGIENNGVVGPDRRGPHNQRRAPTVVNAAFYQALMWDSRFRAESFDPFDNSAGFSFPLPEGSSLSHLDHLLVAQAFTPVVAQVEMAGFDFVGDNDAIRAALSARVDAIPEYRALFEGVFPEVASGAAIRYEHVAIAIAEFEFTLIRADAPLDRFARGEPNSMTENQKLGAMLFFDKAMCAECHIVRGFANEMFSDFEPHVLAVPQVVPVLGNVEFDGPGRNEDYGLERHTGLTSDRYRFRTTPLRNAAFQPSFMHNGAYRCLEDAIRHHTDLYATLSAFSTESLGERMRATLGPYEGLLDRAHLLVLDPPTLDADQFQQIFEFVKYSLTDPDADPRLLMALVPARVPSGLPVHRFDYDGRRPECAI